MTGLTPEQTQEFIKHHEEMLDKTFEYLNASDWKEDTKASNDIIKFFTRSVAGSSFSQVHSVVHIPFGIDKVTAKLDLIPKITPDMPEKERNGNHARDVLFNIEGDENKGLVFFLELESPSRLASPREFVMLRRTYIRGDQHIYLHVSIPYDARPVPKGFVRGLIHFQAYIATPEGPDSTKLDFIVHADPQGSIPGWIYNSVAVSQGNAAKQIRDDIIAENSK